MNCSSWRNSARRDCRIALLLTLLVLCVSCYTLVCDIRGNSPYTSYVDEPTLMNSAADILRTGNFKPQFFVYPSLPTYVTAAAMALGDFVAAAHGDKIDATHLPAFLFPYYPSSYMSSAPKLLFALLGVIATYLAGLSMARAYANRHLTWLVPLIMFFSSLYLRNSTYLNPNILACFFIFACLASLIEKSDTIGAALIPGIFAGMATACKYNFGLIILAPMLNVFLYPHAYRGRKLAVLWISFVLSYLLCAPYSLLDLPEFLNGTAFQIWHYQHGHPGHEADVPGWPQALHYLDALYQDFGAAILLLAAIGLTYALRVNARITAVFSIFPVFLFAYMSTQKATFTHNLLPTYMWIAMYAALGFFFVLSACVSLPRKAMRVLAMAVLALALVSSLPWNVAWARLTPHIDSRNELAHWIRRYVHPGSTILIASEIGIDYHALKDTYNFIPFLSAQGLPALQAEIKRSKPDFVVLPVFTYDPRDPKEIPTFDGGAADALAEEKANELNAAYATLPYLVQMGQRKVIINYMTPTPKNSPMLFIVRVKNGEAP